MSAPIFDNSLGGLRQMLDLRMQQHGLVSANIANADTPEFQAQRVDFEAALGLAAQKAASSSEVGSAIFELISLSTYELSESPCSFASTSSKRREMRSSTAAVRAQCSWSLRIVSCASPVAST